MHAASILVLGDSISAAYGVDKDSGWVSLLQRHLDSHCAGMQVKNASVSGEITAGGLARLPDLLATHEPVVVVIQLGGNDGLRGLPPARMQANLAAMIDTVRSSSAEPVLLGMLIPPNYGQTYTALFKQVFQDLSTEQGVPFVPFFLDQVATRDHLMQDDGIHPNQEAQPILLENAWTVLENVLQPWCDP